MNTTKPITDDEAREKAWRRLFPGRADVAAMRISAGDTEYAAAVASEQAFRAAFGAAIEHERSKRVTTDEGECCGPWGKAKHCKHPDEGVVVWPEPAAPLGEGGPT